MDTAEKIRENRARRAVERRGYLLQKSRRRDPAAWDYGTYQITDPASNTLVHADWDTGRGWGLTLGDVEDWLSR